MEQNFLKYVYDCFAELVKKYGFSKENELNDGQSYSIEYRSNTFVIKLEKYRREFYATLYKTGNPDSEVNLFNLLHYLNQDSSNVPKSDYFVGEDDIEECYRKQLNHISATVYDNFTVINEFFSNRNFDSKFADIKKFILNKYPELFKKS
jgi:hypothetical protein